MNEAEIDERVSALPARFADRLDPVGLADVSGASLSGEWGEAVDILVCGLIKSSVPVAPQERDELRASLEAMGMPIDSIADLNVED